MKLTWSPAVTLDGNIATSTGNSDWPTETDGKIFSELVKSNGFVIVGASTFEQYKGEVFPIDGAMTFVWTRHPDSHDDMPGVTYISGTPDLVIESITNKGFAKGVLAGGSTTNNAFVAAGLVDEITATIYPLLLGNGMPLLSLNNFELKLRLLETKEIGDGVIRNRYKVL
jgi:dihydrofolate reductase